MEVFSLLFDEATRIPEFQFHPKCQALEVSHLIFADDLFLLSTAKSRSMNVMNSVLLEFTALSSLSPNLHKSEILLLGVSDEEGMELCKILAMKRGYLPIKYLGVPLLSTKLSLKDCFPIIEKIKKENYVVELKSFDFCWYASVGKVSTAEYATILE